MCTQKPPHDYSEQLYGLYKEAFNKYINEKVGVGEWRDLQPEANGRRNKAALLHTMQWPSAIRTRPTSPAAALQVLPSLREHRDEVLLKELYQRWQNHKLMVRWLSRFFNYLDRCVHDGARPCGVPHALHAPGFLPLCGCMASDLAGVRCDTSTTQQDFSLLCLVQRTQLPAGTTCCGTPSTRSRTWASCASRVGHCIATAWLCLCHGVCKACMDAEWMPIALHACMHACRTMSTPLRCFYTPTEPSVPRRCTPTASHAHARCHVQRWCMWRSRRRPRTQC